MSDSQSNPAYSKYTDRPGMQHALRTMPRWKWKLLGVALVVGCLGLIGQATTYMRTGQTVTTTGTTPVVQPLPSPSGSNSVPSGSSGFVTGQASKFNTDTTPTVTPQPTTPTSTPTIPEMMTPFMSHVGFSLFVGVIVGLIFRTFLRVGALLAALIAVGIAALAHYNVDISPVKAQVAGAESWISTEGYKIKDLLFNALPSSTAATVGFLFGFKRK